jgi:hypothetical protein
VAVVAVPLMAASRITTPGRYQHWGPDIDEMEIFRQFSAADYSKVVVEPLDGSSALKEGDADLNGVVTRILNGATKPFTDGLKANLSSLAVVEAVPSDAAGTLIVRTRITTLDPGSRSKRIFVGFGAGAARTEVEVQLVDAHSGEVLVRFIQERRSGIERFGRGSSYEEIMKRNLDALGEDTANVLKVF